jgi:hypothetical protein
MITGWFRRPRLFPTIGFQIINDKARSPEDLPNFDLGVSSNRHQMLQGFRRIASRNLLARKPL